MLNKKLKEALELLGGRAVIKDQNQIKINIIILLSFSENLGKLEKKVLKA